MFGLGKQEMSVLVLRDAEDIEDAVRAALGSAPPEERPGLERALALVTEAGTRPDGELHARWVRQVLAKAGVQGPPDSVPAIKALREAAPGLSLLSAVQLAKSAAATPAA